MDWDLRRLVFLIDPKLFFC